MVLLIQPSNLELFLVLIIIGVVVVLGIIGGVLLLVNLVRKKKKSRISAPFEGYYHQDYEDVTSQETYDFTQKSVYYCPYCGFQLTMSRSFCPSCGKSLKIQE
jgi:prepilin signal peptidase PulO-like enzyme (type II secretory pathway)